jgi:hypothetical protein
MHFMLWFLVSGIEFSFGIVVSMFCIQVSHKQWWRMQLTGTRTDLVTLVLYIANYIQFGYIWKWGLLYSFVHQNGNFKGESDDKPICWGNNRFSDTHFLSHQVKYADGVTRNLVSLGYRWVTLAVWTIKNTLGWLVNMGVYTSSFIWGVW